MKIYVATKNVHKLQEFQVLFEQLSATWATLPDDVPEAPETGRTFVENATAKAMYYAEYVDGCVLADDSGLVVPALAGEPGVFSARYAGRHGDDAANNAKLLQQLKQRGVTAAYGSFVCALVLVANRAVAHAAIGHAQGVILPEARGTSGFGYDPLFFVPAAHATLGELPMAMKNRYSHRAAAVRQMRKWLEGHADAFLSRQ